GVLAFISLTAGIVLLFQVNTTLGLVGAIVSLSALPFIFGFMLKVAPSTPIFRWMTLTTPERAAAETSADEPSRQGVTVGQEGTVVTDLRPVGTCLIAGKRCECLSDAGILRAGTPVRVVFADGMN